MIKKFILIISLSLLSLQVQANMEIKGFQVSFELSNDFQQEYTILLSHLSPINKNGEPICQMSLHKNPDLFFQFDSNVFSGFVNPSVLFGYAPDAPSEYRPPLFSGIKLSPSEIPILQTPYCNEEQSEIIRWALQDAGLLFEIQHATLPSMKKIIASMGKYVYVEKLARVILESIVGMAGGGLSSYGGCSLAKAGVNDDAAGASNSMSTIGKGLIISTFSGNPSNVKGSLYGVLGVGLICGLEEYINSTE